LVNHITLERYDLALQLADSLERVDSSDLAGKFFQLTVLNNQVIDYEKEGEYDRLTTLALQIETACNNRIDSGDNSSLVRFYLGSAVGFRMIHDLRAENYLDAILHGTRAADWLEEAVRIDSTCYDAYVGLGNYYYFKSRHAGVLRSTGIVSDQRDEGIRLLQLGAERGLLTALAAKSSLAWIAIDQEDYPRAIGLAKELLKEYPNNRAFHWCLGRAQLKSELWPEAIVTYRALLTSLRRVANNNHYNEIGCLRALAFASSKLNDWQMTLEYADQALALESPTTLRDRTIKNLKHLKELRQEALKRLPQPNEGSAER
jgi:tetratricopeptide (TPR) repeat protein